MADGQRFYQFGGRFVTVPDQPVRYFNEVWRYDTATEVWAEIADLPSDIQLARPVRAESAILLIGRGMRSMGFDPVVGVFSDSEGLPEDALVDHFAWLPPFIVGAGGETRQERPRRRANWTFIGRPKVSADR